MAHVITLTSQKGGSGKSTLAINLASEWHRRGLKTLLVDCDPQGTVLTWSKFAELDGVETPTVIGVGNNVSECVSGMRGGYDVVVIDTAGKRSTKALEASTVADFLLIPCKPGPSDVWALHNTAKDVAMLKGAHPKLKAGIVMNQTTRTGVSKTLRGVLEDVPIPVMDTAVSQRVAVVEAPNEGKGITSYAPGSTAARELQALANEIEDAVGIEWSEEQAHGS